jgi:A118 family predicted phage portal protein
MDDRQKVTAAIEKLKQLGFTYNQKAQNIIEECDQWYTNEESEFHTRKNLNDQEVKLEKLNFAKRCCADDANLCEIVEINAGESENKFDGVQEILDENRFGVMYRKQLERLAASGTVGAYIRLDNATLLDNGSVTGGEIRINYINAAGIVPLTVENDEIIECAFVGSDLVRGKNEQTLVVFQRDEKGLYTAETFVFDENNREIADRHVILQLGDVKPFSIMRTAEVNNLDDMEGYGLPKLYNAIPALKIVDLCWNILNGDLSKGDKLLLINELLATIKKNDEGKPVMTAEQKKLFILLGEKLPDQKSLIQEYNPEIRTGQIKEAMELALSLLSMMFGYGTKKYTFENAQIQTATQYIGERQDEMQELNKQRQEAIDYIEGLVEAIIWFSNTFQGTTWELDEEICVEFDDSYIEDKNSKLERMRADALSFPEVKEFTIQYVMEVLNCEREEAISYINGEDPDADDEPED